MATATKNPVGRPATFNGKTVMFPAQNIPVKAAENIRRIAKAKGVTINAVVGHLFNSVRQNDPVFSNL